MSDSLLSAAFAPLAAAALLDRPRTPSARRARPRPLFDAAVDPIPTIAAPRQSSPMRRPAPIPADAPLTAPPRPTRAPDRSPRRPALAPSTTQYGYDARGLITSITDPNGLVTTITYDAALRVRSITRPGRGTETITPVVSRLLVDPAFGAGTPGNPAPMPLPSDAYATVLDAAGATTRYRFDAFGYVTEVTDPLSNVTTYAYDDLDRPTRTIDPLGKSTYFTYDAAGRLTERKDRLNRRIQYAYDDLDRVTAERWYAAGGALQRTITSTYDALDRPTSISDPDATLTFTYDAVGRVASAGTSGTGSGQPNLTLTYAYDAVGNRTRMADGLSGAGWAGAGVTELHVRRPRPAHSGEPHVRSQRRPARRLRIRRRQPPGLDVPHDRRRRHRRHEHARLRRGRPPDVADSPGRRRRHAGLLRLRL